VEIPLLQYSCAYFSVCIRKSLKTIKRKGANTMKRLFALLLVLVMVVGLMAACNNKPQPTDPTTTTGGSTTDPTTTTKNDKPFKGKELQVYGTYNPASYGDISKMTGEGNYLWMINAAIEEWAAMNEVTIVNKGSYNVNSILAAVTGGDRPDIAFAGSGTYPAGLVYGIMSEWTDEEYEAICESLDNTMWVDMMEYGGKKAGVTYPWIGSNMLYYNARIFEETETKAPKDYFLEGKWDWDAFKACMEGVTTDLDNDGKFDYVGLRDTSWAMLRPENTFDEKGALTMDVVNSQMAFDFIELKTVYMYQKKFIATAGAIATNVAYPLAAMQISDCEPYNWKHTFNTCKNGDPLVAVPMPVYKSKDGQETYAKVSYSQGGMYIMKASDDREAALSLIKYILEAGQKYMEMLSDGVVKTKFAGLQGTCDVSKAYLEAFTAACAQRKEDLKNVKHYNPELVAAYYEYFAEPSTRIFVNFNYADITSKADKDWHLAKEIATQDAASALAAAKAKYQTAIDNYNKLYIPGWTPPAA